MIALVPFLPLALVLSSGPGPLSGAPQPGLTRATHSIPTEFQGPSVLRLYDLSTVRLSSSEEFEEDPFHANLLPYIDPVFRRGEDLFGEWDESSDDGTVVNLITSVFGAEFEYEGREVWMTDDQRVAVLGPAGLHERVRALVDFLEAQANAQADITVDVLRLPRGTSAAVPSGAVVPAQDVDAWLARAAQEGSHASYAMGVRSDRSSVLKLTRDVEFVADYDVEIAQAAAIADPITVSVPVGLRLGLRGSAAEGGLWLALSMKDGREYGEPERRNLELAFVSTAEGSKTQHVRDAGLFRNMHVISRGAGFSTFLPDGQALVLRTGIDLARHGDEHVLVLRRSGGTLAPSARLRVDADGSELFIANLSSILPPRVVSSGTLMWPGAVTEALHGNFGDVLLQVGLRWDSTEVFLESMSGRTAAMEFELVDRWMLAFPYDDEGRREQERVRESFAALLAQPTLMQLSMTLERNGQEALRSSLPVRMGQSCSMVLGLESLGVPDYDVEVAQFSSVADPKVVILFDGVALWVQPKRTADGGVLFDVRGSAHLLDKGERVSLGGQVLGELDMSTYSHLAVNERRQVPERDGAWTAVFGEASGDQDLRLTLALTR